MTAPADTLLGRLLARAAEGDEQAAADFEALRAANVALAERSQTLARQQALRLIHRPRTHPNPTRTGRS